MPILWRRKQTQRGNVCLREGPFSIGSSDSGARGPSLRVMLCPGAAVCGVCGHSAWACSVLSALSQALAGSGEGQTASDRAQRGCRNAGPSSARCLCRRLSTLWGCRRCPAPGLRSTFPMPGSWLPHSPTAPGHPPASAHTAPPVPPKQVASPLFSGPHWPHFRALITIYSYLCFFSRCLSRYELLRVEIVSGKQETCVEYFQNEQVRS